MSPGGGPRLLLRRLREIMAEQTSAQMRLDKLVTTIASNMVAEVCSIYLRRAGKALELFATEGLRPEAVHTTRMKEGEGLVGMVGETAEAVNLSDAPSDPHFSYRPETGEDPFKSFLGVPIVRGGQVFGVLTVQNKAERAYAEEEVEALQTVAMVLAEVVAQGGFFNIAELDEPELRIDRPRKFVGDGLSEGIAVGPVVLHEPRVRVDHMIADNPVDELRRLEEAISALRESVDGMLSSSELDLTGEGREVIEAYRLFAYDQGWRQRMRDAVRTGLTAEAAVERVQDETRLRVQRLGDPILRERAHDLDDLARRLLRHLTGERRQRPGDAAQCGAGGARHGAGRATGLRPRQAGRPCAGGGGFHQPCRHRGALHGTAHGSLAHGIVDNARPGDAVAVDGETGEVHLRPAAEIVKAFEPEGRAARPGPGPFRRRARPAGGDPRRCAHPADDECRAGIRHAAAGAIGRRRHRAVPHRTAIHDRRDHAAAGRPGGLLQTILDAAGDKPVVFRTLDLGGDKVLPYARWEREENPALGWRAIRIALDRPGAAALPGPRHADGVRGPHLAHPVADGRRTWTSSTAPAP